jgi:Uma2 family endonuclease
MKGGRSEGGIAMSEVELINELKEEFLDLPGDDGVERMVIEGELFEEPMSERNPSHSRLSARITYHLERWVDQQPEPRGQVLTGDASFRLRRDPDTKVGIDVAYISADLAVTVSEGARFVDGIPILAVEILSPSDKQQTITKKVRAYLDTGVALVWVVEPVFRTITIYQPDAGPRLVNDGERLSAEPHLPGFEVAVADVFRR